MLLKPARFGTECGDECKNINLQDGIFFVESSRKIFLTGVIDDENITEAITTIQQLEEESEEDIDLYINSDGGILWSTLALCDIIRTSKCKINTYGLGRVCSAAALILSMGTGRRYVYKMTRIMLHEASWDFSGKVSDIEIQFNELKDLQNVIMECLSQATGRSLEKIKEDIKLDYWMSAEEALEYGLVDEII